MKKNLFKSTKSFTLIELLIAVSIFSILLVACASVFINFQGAKRRGELVRYIKNEGDFLMERIKREIRNGTVDYEEYYNQNSLNSSYYATNYGKYGQLFFHGGSKCNVSDQDDYGVRCKGTTPDCNNAYWTSPCTEMDYESKDLNMWEWTIPPSPITNVNALSSGFQDELYLIDASGTKRTILKTNNYPSFDESTKLITLKLVGEDQNSNGIIDSWFCAPDFLTILGKIKDDCAAKSATYSAKKTSSSGDTSLTPTGNIPNNDSAFFVSITPSRLYVSSLKFFISPLENPRKGQAEDLGEVYVTIVLSVKPLEKYSIGIPGGVPEYTMQTTVTAGAKNFIQSWHGVLEN